MNHCKRVKPHSKSLSKSEIYSEKRNKARFKKSKMTCSPGRSSVQHLSHFTPDHPHTFTPHHLHTATGPKPRRKWPLQKDAQCYPVRGDAIAVANSFPAGHILWRVVQLACVVYTVLFNTLRTHENKCINEKCINIYTNTEYMHALMFQKEPSFIPLLMRG